METNNENISNDLNDQNQGGESNSFGTGSGMDKDTLSGDENTGNIPGAYSSNESLSGSNSTDEDDDLATGNDINSDEELIDTDDDLDDEDELDTEDDTATTSGAYAGSSTGAGSDSPDEIPEQGESDNVGTGYDNQTEVERQQGGSEVSWSEQTDVTPPNDHGFPDAAGLPKTDFTSRPHGRTTGRMVGHEPGTEGI